MTGLRLVLLVALVGIASGFGTATAGPADGQNLRVLWILRVPGRSLSYPLDVAVDRRGVAFLLDSGNRSIALFSPEGEFLREITGRGVWRDPFALAVGPDGTVFLADGDAGRVLELDLSGKVRHEYPLGKNSRATGVALFGDSVFCADNRNDRVVVFKRKGGRIDAWGKKGDRPGELNAPFRLTVDGGGRVFVTDVLNARVQWFSPFGKPLGSLKRFGAGEGRIFRPSSLSLDNRGRIWVGDSFTGLVQLFEENGTFVQALSRDNDPLVFGDPIGVAAGPNGIWVVDQRENRAGLFRK